MGDYLVQVKYEKIAFENLVANPQNREGAVKPAIEKLGGEMKGLWFSFGKYDIVTIVTLPDNVSVEAIAMSVRASGYIRDFKAIPLLTVDESIAAMKMASTVTIKPPSK